MLRKTCLDCTRKHISQAIILLIEFVSGDYDEHFWLAMGHLAEAEAECMGKYPSLASKIRDERVRTMEEADYYPDLMPLITEATRLADIEEAEKLSANEDAI